MRTPFGLDIVPEEFERYWHTQSIVPLPSKNGRAYFALTDSFRRGGSFYIVRTDADAYDSVNDGVNDTPGTDGEVVYMDAFDGNSPIGDWNHPGDIRVMGDLLLIAAQQWHGDTIVAGFPTWLTCGEYASTTASDAARYGASAGGGVVGGVVGGLIGGALLGPIGVVVGGIGGATAGAAAGGLGAVLALDADYPLDKYEGQDEGAAVFYDIRNPEQPVYLGKITASELGFSRHDSISGVGLSKTTNGLWGFYAAGSGGIRHYRGSTTPWPSLSPEIWEPYTLTVGNTAQFLSINSYEIGTATGGPERLLSVNSHNAGDIPGAISSFTAHYESPNPQNPNNPVLSYDLKFETTSRGSDSEDPGPGLFSTTNLRQDCRRGGGTASVSNTGQVQIQCPLVATALSPGTGDCIGTTTACIVSFHYSMPDTNQPPGISTAPSPADGLVGVSITTGFSWTGGGDPDGDDVTYGVWLIPPSPASPVELCRNIAETVCIPGINGPILGRLLNATTYTWFVEAKDGSKRTKGPLWTFTTVPGNMAPNVPSSPGPISGGTRVPVTTVLAWNGGDPDAGDSVTYDVFLKKASDPSYATVCDDVTTPSCDLPGVLDYSSTYFWSVESSDGETTTPGPDWSFSTPPGITLSMTATPDSFRNPDEIVQLTYTITNISNETLSEPLSVLDTRLGLISPCGTTPLQPGGTATCTRSFAVTAADVAARTLSSDAYAQYGTIVSQLASASVTYDSPERVRLLKEAPSLIFGGAGEIILYTFTIVNVGEVPLAGPFSITDTSFGSIATCGTGPLAQGATTSCMYPYTTTAQDVDFQSINGEAWVLDGGTSILSPVARLRLDLAQKGLGFGITMSPLSFSTAGEVITYTYTIINEGNVPLPGPFTVRIEELTDPITPCGNGPLQVGKSTTCSSTYVVRQNDVEGGSAPPWIGRAQTDGAASATVGVIVPAVNSELVLTTDVTPTIFNRLGDEITYTYTTSNTSASTLIGPFTLVEDRNGEIVKIVCGDFELPAEYQATCQIAHKVDIDDLKRGVIQRDTVVQSGSAASASVHSTVNVGNRVLLLTREATPQGFTVVGDVITYRYLIQNTSDASLDAPFTVLDDLAGTIEACGGTGPLLPSVPFSCTGQYTILEADLDAGSITSDAFVYGDATSSSVQLTLTTNGTSNPPPGGGATPAVFDGGVVNNASFAPSPAPVAPGSIVAVFGSNQNDGSTVLFSNFGADGKLLTSLGGTSVSVNNIPAPMFYSTPGQLGIQIPFELTGQTSAEIQVTVAGQTSLSSTLILAPFAPGIFTVNQQGTGLAAALHEDGVTPLAELSPAQPGEVIVFFGTGLGAVTPPLATGEASAGNQTVSVAMVTIDGIPAEVLFSGAAPGFVGLNQINLRIPVNTRTASNIPVVLTIGGMQSNSVTIPVGP